MSDHEDDDQEPPVVIDLRKFGPGKEGAPDLSAIRAWTSPIAERSRELMKSIYTGPGVEAFTRNLGEAAQMNVLSRSYSRIIAQSMTAHWPDFSEQVRESMAGLFRTWTSPVVQKLAETLASNLSQAAPPNWLGDHDDALAFKVSTAVDIMAHEGIPLAWIPRAEIVAELVDADTYEQRAQVLVDRRALILDDCRSVLGNIPPSSAVDHLTSLARQAIGAAAAQPAAGQALATAVTDTILRDSHAGTVLLPGRDPATGFTTGDIIAEVDPGLEGTTIGQLGFECARLPLLKAFQMFWPHRGDPIPSTYSRHATVHTAGPVQYTDANTIIAVMLAISLLREAHHQLAAAAISAAG